MSKNCPVRDNAYFFFFNWDLLHARLNSHYEAWSYKKKKHKKITGYRKSVQKESTVNGCLLILDLKPLRSQVKGKHSIRRRTPEPSCARKETVDIDVLVKSRDVDRKIMQSIRITSGRVAQGRVAQGRVAQWLATCARKSRVPGSSPAARYAQG